MKPIPFNNLIGKGNKVALSKDAEGKIVPYDFR